MSRSVVKLDAWVGLRRHTDARIALGRAGQSLTTAAHLEFQLAHAQARDAVHARVDWTCLEEELTALAVPSVRLHSEASDRIAYLQRPDFGRRLDESSRRALRDLSLGLSARPIEYAGDGQSVRFDVGFVLADGLSACAIQRQALPTLAAILPALRACGWRVAPTALVEQGRVAVGDEVGALLEVAIVVVLIGERPGLSSPDSLGIYLTHDPRVGMSDAARNCISNVRPAGLAPALAADKLLYLLRESRHRRLSGVALKDEAPPCIGTDSHCGNFLIAESLPVLSESE